MMGKIRADTFSIGFFYYFQGSRTMNKFIHFILNKSNQIAQTAHVKLQTQQPEALQRTEQIMAKPKVQLGIQAAALLLMAGLTPLANAAGFDSDAKDMANNIYKGIYGFVGVVALIIMLWQCVEGWTGRKSWMDILVTCLWVVAAAASGALVTWLWSKGQSMTFGS